MDSEGGAIVRKQKNADGGQPSAGNTGASLDGSTPHFTTNGTHDQTVDYVSVAAKLAADGLRTHAELEAERDAALNAPTFAPLTFEELLNLPAKTWLIDQVIGAGDIAMVYGAPGCGKTFTVIDLVMAACTGSRWADRFTVARPLTVAYCAGEGVSGLPTRFAAAAQHFGVQTLPSFTFFKTIPQLYTEEAAEIISITQFVREWQGRQAAGKTQPLDILVIDTLHTATTAADENSAKDMGRVLHACRWAAYELGCAVLLVHHTNKNGTAERGSSALRGAMDCMIEIRRISDTGTKAVMSCAKLKDGEGWKDQTFDLTAMGESVRVWWDEPNDSPTSRESGKQQQDINTIIDLLKAKPGIRYPAKAIAERIAVTPAHVNKLLRMAADQDECITSGLQYPDRDYSPRGNPTLYWYVPDDM